MFPDPSHPGVGHLMKMTTISNNSICTLSRSFTNKSIQKNRNTYHSNLTHLELSFELDLVLDREPLSFSFLSLTGVLHPSPIFSFFLAFFCFLLGSHTGHTQEPEEERTPMSMPYDVRNRRLSTIVNLVYQQQLKFKKTLNLVLLQPCEQL